MCAGGAPKNGKGGIPGGIPGGMNLIWACIGLPGWGCCCCWFWVWTWVWILMPVGWGGYCDPGWGNMGGLIGYPPICTVIFWAKDIYLTLIALTSRNTSSSTQELIHYVINQVIKGIASVRRLCLCAWWLRGDICLSLGWSGLSCGGLRDLLLNQMQSFIIFLDYKKRYRR